MPKELCLSFWSSVIFVQAHTGVTVSIAMNSCENSLPWCYHIVFFPSSTLLPGSKPPFLLSSLQSLCKSHLQHKWLLVTSSHLLVSIIFMSLLQTSVKQKWDRPLYSGQLHVKKDLQNPPINRLLLPMFCSHTGVPTAGYRHGQGFMRDWQLPMIYSPSMPLMLSKEKVESSTAWHQHRSCQNKVGHDIGRS